MLKTDISPTLPCNETTKVAQPSLSGYLFGILSSLALPQLALPKKWSLSEMGYASSSYWQDNGYEALCKLLYVSYSKSAGPLAS